MNRNAVKIPWVGALSLGLVILFALSPTVGAAPEWQKLGDRRVNNSIDRDEIRVTAKEGRFAAIKLRVKDRAVHFRDVRVHFANGEVQDVAVRRLIPAGAETRVIQLDGDEKRIIQKVVFWYSTRGRGRVKAEVELWGRG